MPRHVDELQDGEPFPVKPGSNEYTALSFLVSNREYGFTPTEIADRTDINETSASKTMARLFEKGLVERTQGAYYVDPDRADEMKRRLDSIDAAVRLHETAPDDDAYAEDGWEEHVPSIDPEQERENPSRETGENVDSRDESETPVDDLAGDESSES